VPQWARVVVAIAVVRVGVALSVYASGLFPAPDARAIPVWMFAVLASMFSLVGLGLVLGHQHDRRAEWLGGILSLVACPLTNPLVIGAAGGPVAWMVHVRPEAFFSSFVWEFVIRFPADLRGRPAQFARGIAGAAAAVGTLLAAASLIGLSSAPAAWGEIARAVSATPRVFFWPLLLGTSVPAFFVLLRRARTGAADVQRSVRLFVAALMLGLLPFAVEVVVEGIWPAYWAFVHSPRVEPWVGAALFGALATLPFTTAYSVLFGRVVSVRLVLQKAMQYALTRYTIIAATLVPFAALASFIAVHRNEPVLALVSSGWRSTVLGVLTAGGMAMLRLRLRLLAALDRQYFREPYDGRRVLERLMGPSVSDRSELARRVRREIGVAFHTGVDIFLVDASGSLL
jgi:hypothetical protein